MSNRDWNEFVQEQVKNQLTPVPYIGKCTLDFTPFAATLDAFPAPRADALNAWLQEATIPEIHAAFRQGGLTAVELTTFYLHRIRQHDVDHLNTILELNPDALELARAADAARDRGTPLGALHGIPILLKDNIATGDKMHTTAGAAAMRTAHSDRDAFIVQRLRAAGAIILGKTNLSEWANFMTKPSVNGFSVLGGPTRNPYGAFDVGGSSAGSAAAVAANFATVSIGSETSGSIIYPASQNSLYALKPSLGLVSRDRIVPITSKMDTAGPMARSVTDLAILLSVLVAMDVNDPSTQKGSALANVDFVQWLDGEGLRGTRIGVIQQEQETRIGDAAIQEGALGVLRAVGAEIVEIHFEPPDVDYLPILLYGIQHDLALYLAAIGEHAPVHSLAEIVEFNRADLANRAPYEQHLLEEALAQEMTAEEYDALAERNRMQTAEAILDALTTHHLDFIFSLSNGFTKVYSPAGFPAISIPAGYRDSGEPLNITLVGNLMSDHRLVAAAYAFEQMDNLRRAPDLGEG